MKNWIMTARQLENSSAWALHAWRDRWTIRKHNAAVVHHGSIMQWAMEDKKQTKNKTRPQCR